MTLEDKLGLGKTLLDVVLKAEGNIEQYYLRLSAKVKELGRKAHEISDEVIQMKYAQKLYDIEKRIGAKFIVTPEGVKLKPYVSDQTQRIPIVSKPE